nr:MAG TPA: hypothetical protein [Caudoviricetes sp.]
MYEQNRGENKPEKSQKACGNLFCTLFCADMGNSPLIISQMQP